MKNCIIVVGLLWLYVGLCINMESNPRQLTFDTTVASDLLHLFQPQNSGWLGADVSTSIKLNDTTYLWLWGDTLYGNISNGQRNIIGMPRNSVGLLQNLENGNMKFFVRVNSTNLFDDHLGFFSPYNESDWFWVTNGILYNNSLYLFAMNVWGAGQWGFKVSRTVCLIINNPFADPFDWVYQQVPIPQSSYTMSFTSGITAVNNVIYLMGEYNGTFQFLSKIDGASFENQQWENLLFLTPSGTWNSDYSSLQNILDVGISEGTIVYQPDFDFWYTFYIPFYTNQLCITTAPDITGPWSKFKQIYTIPTIMPDTFYYAVKSHPEFAGKNEIIATYCSNGNWSDLSNPKLYVPNPIRISISSLFN